MNLEERNWIKEAMMNRDMENPNHCVSFTKIIIKTWDGLKVKFNEKTRKRQMNDKQTFKQGLCFVKDEK